MSMWWVVNKETKEMIHSCDDAGKLHCSIGADQVWLEVPEDVAAGNCKVIVVSPAVPEVPAVEAVEASEGVEAVEAQDAIPAVPEVLGLADGSAEKTSPQWDAMRAERNKRLTACDWTVLTDADLTTAKKNAWKAYRTLLRDLPEVTEDPSVVTWPVAP